MRRARPQVAVLGARPAGPEDTSADGWLLEGTLFLPVVLQPAWVVNHDPEVHVWSDPFKNAVDFGLAAPQWTVFSVVAPQVGQRVLVYNPVTDDYGWLDVAGVGPAASDE